MPEDWAHPDEEARGRFESSSPQCDAITVLRTSSDKTAAVPAGRRSDMPCTRRRHSCTPSPAIARPLPRECYASRATPVHAAPGTRISPQGLCIVLSTVQLSAHGSHPAPCTIRGRAGLSRRCAPLGRAGEPEDMAAEASATRGLVAAVRPAPPAALARRPPPHSVREGRVSIRIRIRPSSIRPRSCCHRRRRRRLLPYADARKTDQSCHDGRSLHPA